MATTIPALDPCSDIQDTDLILVTHSNGLSEKTTGEVINKRSRAIIADSTTITWLPIKSGNVVRIFFTVELTAVNGSTALVIKYNNVNYTVKVPRNGSLVNFTAYDLGSNTYKYLQANTELDLLSDGTNLIILGNPVMLSTADYTIYADGIRRVNAVTSGSKDMVTSGAVKTIADTKANQTDLAVPTDAVLHYSFDDVPDLPDGTATERKLNGDTYNVTFQSNGVTTEDPYVAGDNKIHKSNVNGNVNFKSDISTDRSRGAFKLLASYGGKTVVFEINAKTSNLAIRIEYKVNQSDVAQLFYPNGTDIPLGKNKIILAIPSNYYYYTIVFYGRANMGDYTEWELLNFYIGDGSYVTPIIDNASGQSNATNNGIIAVQGVSGKAGYFPSKSSFIRNDFISKPPYSFSCWVKLDSDSSNTQYIIDGRKTINNSTTFQDFGVLMLSSRRIAVGVSSIGEDIVTPINTMLIGVWQNITVTCINSGNGNKFSIYQNGVLVKEGTTTQATTGFAQLTIGGQYASPNISEQVGKSIDDFQFFNRALSADEVQALYLNKANTPKYYEINDWKITPKILLNTVNLFGSGTIYDFLELCVTKGIIIRGKVCAFEGMQMYDSNFNFTFTDKDNIDTGGAYIKFIGKYQTASSSNTTNTFCFMIITRTGEKYYYRDERPNYVHVSGWVTL